MSAALLHGVVQEVGPSEESGQNFVRLAREQGSPEVCIDGLTDDEARAFAVHFGQLVRVSIESAA